MSYDFELYTRRTHAFEQPRMNAGSNVVLDGPDRLEDEDIPQDYRPIVGRKRVLYRIHLEGDLTVSDQKVVDNWLHGLVADTKGVLIDLQTEAYETATKTGSIASNDAKVEDCGWMSFYFTDGESFFEHGFEEMLKCISKSMPDALPKRYGYYEPLQHRVEGDDYADLLAAFHNETKLFMKSRTPFGHIFMSVPCGKTFERYHPRHFMRRKYLMGHVSFELRPKIFSNPSVFTNLKNLFAELCVLLDVVYAEISTENKPGSSWLWYGLPDTEPHTLCIGPIYQKVWAEISERGQKVGLHHRVVSTDRFGNAPPRPPVELIAPDQNDENPQEKPNYAPLFPFDYGFDYEKYIW